ncbi:MAG: heme ABC transporter permease [Alphaproteobacteria bacterium]|nr:heme ABC transporter permease [Alphaproteobacteria bacterium]
MGMFDYLANPARFQRLALIISPIAWMVFAVSLAAGLYFAFFNSPADYQQGETVRIMYIHVPSAWMALMAYCGMAVMAVFYLVWKHPLADIAARAMALPGAGFALICLITGSLWGRPMWGTWWVWDARLTSMLILLFLYIGYMVLVDSFDRDDRGGKAGSVLLLIGAVNIPIIKFSVDWWNTLHQGASVFRSGGPLIDSTMLVPLFLMALAALAWFIGITIMRMRTQLGHRRLLAMRGRAHG